MHGVTLFYLLATVGTNAFAFTPIFASHNVKSVLMQAPQGVGEPTELPDSLDDSALIAARACSQLCEASPRPSRCRVDFDTSVGDETYTTLKSSTEFMQKFVTGLCYELIPGAMEERQKEMAAMAEARAELQRLMVEEQGSGSDDEMDARKKELSEILANGGRDPGAVWEGPKARIYFPDEGNAALARRDWLARDFNGQPLVPPCVAFSSLGGVQVADVSKDALVFYFCPKASESEFVEDILYKSEKNDELLLSVFVNPLLVDMGVTGFGMAGRMLRERLIDPLDCAYYLRTLPWGALTRTWPRAYTVWQEDEGAMGGYKMIKSLDSLPSNPEVLDIYDVANGIQAEKKEGLGLLNAIGDFVNGMTRL